MSGTVTLVQLRTRIRERANKVSVHFVSESSLTVMVNNSIASLVDLIIQHRGEEYFEKTDSINLISGKAEYSLPGDFFKLIAIQHSNGVPLETFDRREYGQKCNGLRYRISNNKLHLNRSNQSCELKIFYVPLAPTLSGDSDTCDFYNGWDEYVTCDVAKTLLEMEESDATHLERQLMRLEQRIAQSAPKDIHRPEKIIDVSSRGSNVFREIY